VEAPQERTLAQKLDAARQAVSTPPDRVEGAPERTSTTSDAPQEQPAEAPATEQPEPVHADHRAETTAEQPAVDGTPHGSPFSRLSGAATAGELSADEAPSPPEPQAVAEPEPQVVEEPVVETIENEAPAAQLEEPAPVEEQQPAPVEARHEAPANAGGADDR